MWSMTFNATKGVIHYYRQKEDRWTYTMGGFITGFVTHARASLQLGLVQGSQIGALFYLIGTMSEKSGQFVEQENKRKQKEHEDE